MKTCLCLVLLKKKRSYWRGIFSLIISIGLIMYIGTEDRENCLHFGKSEELFKVGINLSTMITGRLSDNSGKCSEVFIGTTDDK